MKCIKNNTGDFREIDHDWIMEMLAGELFEMVAFGWTDDEARENEDLFFERIGNYAEGLTKEEVWEVWNNVWEYTCDNLLERE